MLSQVITAGFLARFAPDSAVPLLLSLCKRNRNPENELLKCHRAVAIGTGRRNHVSQHPRHRQIARCDAEHLVVIKLLDDGVGQAILPNAGYTIVALGPDE